MKKEVALQNCRMTGVQMKFYYIALILAMLWLTLCCFWSVQYFLLLPTKAQSLPRPVAASGATGRTEPPRLTAEQQRPFKDAYITILQLQVELQQAQASMDRLLSPQMSQALCSDGYALQFSPQTKEALCISRK